MKTSIFSQTFLAVAMLMASASAHAEDRFNLQQWSKDFTTAVKGKSPAATEKLVDFKTLEKRILITSEDSENKALMKKARELFAKGNFDEARVTYNEVSKSSGYWLQAVEERGWTYFRQSQFDEVLAQTKTLTSNQFSEYINPEGYFLQALAELRTCNYKELFATNLLFKEKQKARLVEIQELAESGTNESFKDVVLTANAFPLKFSDVKGTAQHLPQLFYKDLELQKQLLRYKISEKALSIINTESGQGIRKDLASSMQKTLVDAAAGLKNRMKKLAQQETEDNFKVVQKINLVEVEAIQRLHIDIEMDKKLFKKDKFKDTTVDQLVFVDDGRPWIDELDKYEVRAKSCPQNVRRKM